MSTAAEPLSAPREESPDPCEHAAEIEHTLRLWARQGGHPFPVFSRVYCAPCHASWTAVVEEAPDG